MTTYSYSFSIEIMKALNNISMFSSYVGFQITTLSKRHITKMTHKGPFSFMHFPNVTFHFTAVCKILVTLRAFSRRIFFSFVNFFDMIVHTRFLIEGCSTKLTTVFLPLMNHMNMVLQLCFTAKVVTTFRAERAGCIFMTKGNVFIETFFRSK